MKPAGDTSGAFFKIGCCSTRQGSFGEAAAFCAGCAGRCGFVPMQDGEADARVLPESRLFPYVL